MHWFLRRAVEDPHYLGVAKEGSTFLSKFVFYWVNPLIKKGRMGLLQTPDDVFDVPPTMVASVVSEKFRAARDSLGMRTDSGIVVMRVLFKYFGAQFFAIGSLLIRFEPFANACYHAFTNNGAVPTFDCQ